MEEVKVNNEINNTKKIKEKTDKKSKLKDMYYNVYKKIYDNDFFNSLRKTLIILLPFIIIGMLSIFLRLFFISPLKFSTDSIIIVALDWIYQIFGGFFEIILIAGLTFNYAKTKTKEFGEIVSTVIVALLFGMISLEAYGLYDGENVFLALFISWVTPTIIHKFFSKKHTDLAYSNDTRKFYTYLLRLLLPILIITLILSPLIILYFLEVPTLSSLANILVSHLSNLTNVELINGLIYVFSLTLLTFIGISCNSVVSLPLLEGEIINTSFYLVLIMPTFIIGLLIALIIFRKKKSEKLITSTGLFSSSYSMVNLPYYGLNVALNPMSFIPFIISPLLMMFISYFILKGFNINLVETKNIIIFRNGYLLTNSYVGILLQVVNIIISLLVAIPFVLLDNYARNRYFEENLKKLFNEYEKAKAVDSSVNLYEFDYKLSEVAKALVQQLIIDMAIMDDIRGEIKEFKNNYSIDTSNNEGVKKRKTKAEKNYEIAYRNMLDDKKKRLKIKSAFQPIISGKSVEFMDENPSDFEITGMECLMRWYYNGSYVIPPLAIQLAKDANLEYEINHYLWESMLINVDRSKCKSFITFNISMVCLENDNFVSDLLGLFEFYGISPEGFVIEITEEDTFTHEDDVLNKIKLLKEKGFVFAIDDYGAGQTSMKYFSTNAFELVKIDGELVRKAKENEQVYDIIGNIKDLGKNGKYGNINFKVLCEYIEDKEMFERLFNLKVDYFQGYLFGKAVSFDEIVLNDKMPKGKTQKHV